jgi:hypothetical protein
MHLRYLYDDVEVLSFDIDIIDSMIVFLDIDIYLSDPEIPAWGAVCPTQYLTHWQIIVDTIYCTSSV